MRCKKECLKNLKETKKGAQKRNLQLLPGYSKRLPGFWRYRSIYACSFYTHICILCAIIFLSMQSSGSDYSPSPPPLSPPISRAPSHSHRHHLHTPPNRAPYRPHMHTPPIRASSQLYRPTHTSPALPPQSIQPSQSYNRPPQHSVPSTSYLLQHSPTPVPRCSSPTPPRDSNSYNSPKSTTSVIKDCNY